MNYYNENDPRAADWLKELIKGGQVPDGIVDERSIRDVQPEDLDGFIQCHFFAGIGGWAYALDLARWPDEQPCWTGSCPCQPFSVAGKGKGDSDDRHLWPEFARLIRQRNPPVVFGEQVASGLGRKWLARVRLDLEEMGYAVGAGDICAAGAGAPHIRQRLYWLADCESDRWHRCQDSTKPGGRSQSEKCGTNGRLAHNLVEGLEGHAGNGHGGNQPGRVGAEAPGPVAESGQSCGSGAWSNSELIWCRDEKWRRIESGTFPLVASVPKGVVRSSYPGPPIDANNTAEARIMRLKGYGNALCIEVAKAFIEAYIQAKYA